MYPVRVVSDVFSVTDTDICVFPVPELRLRVIHEADVSIVQLTSDITFMYVIPGLSEKCKAVESDSRVIPLCLMSIGIRLLTPVGVTYNVACLSVIPGFAAILSVTVLSPVVGSVSNSIQLGTELPTNCHVELELTVTSILAPLFETGESS